MGFLFLSTHFFESKMKRDVFLIHIFLAIATLVAFWPVTSCNFIGLDDPEYVTENPHIQHGISVEGVQWAFTGIHVNFYHPLTMISHMLDAQIYGLNPQGHHLTNLLFHLTNTLLLFSVLSHMTKAPWKSAFVAALFAVHPLNVESVAWVSERKNVLSTFFWMLTMVAYVHYVERPRLKNYLTVILLFVLGLMAKPTLVTLPFVMLLLDHWPLRRFEQGRPEMKDELHGLGSRDGKMTGLKVKSSSLCTRDAAAPNHSYRLATTLPLIIEKIPLFILIPVFSILAYIAEGEAVENLPWNVKVPNALVSYAIYIIKAIWPANLSVFYPHRGLWPVWQVAGASLLLASVTGVVIMTARKYRYLFVGWLWFIGTMVPAIGIVQISDFGRADRFTYIPTIGLFIMVAWGVPELLKTGRYSRQVLAGLSLSIFLVLSATTWVQVGYWRSDSDLFNHSLETTTGNCVLYANRGVAYAKLGKYKQAIADFDKVLEIDPVSARIYYERGLAQAMLGNYMQAINDYDSSIRINPRFAMAYSNRGSAYTSIGNRKKAILDYDKALQLNPQLASAYYNRGNAYVALGRIKDAIADFDSAIQLNPKSANAYCNRGSTYAALGDQRQAILDYDRAIRIDPRLGLAYYGRGRAYAVLGNREQAIADYNRTIEISPEDALAYKNRALLYNGIGNQQQAYEDLKSAAMLGDKEAQDLLRRQGISIEEKSRRVSVNDAQNRGNGTFSKECDPALSDVLPHDGQALRDWLNQPEIRIER